MLDNEKENKYTFPTVPLGMKANQTALPTIADNIAKAHRIDKKSTTSEHRISLSLAYHPTKHNIISTIAKNVYKEDNNPS